jgi:hypothetical protein
LTLAYGMYLVERLVVSIPNCKTYNMPPGSAMCCKAYPSHRVTIHSRFLILRQNTGKRSNNGFHIRTCCSRGNVRNLYARLLPYTEKPAFHSQVRSVSQKSSASGPRSIRRSREAVASHAEHRIHLISLKAACGLSNSHGYTIHSEPATSFP